MDRMATVLLIDDDASLLDVLSLALEDAGHQVVTARDGAEGLEAVTRSKPALIISDINMPRVDGFALLRKLRERKVPTPLILLTSRDSEIDEALGLELGADDYVAKPFSSRVLMARVGSLLRREEMRRAGEEGTRTVEGELELSAERLEVRLKGVPVEVTVTEFRMLEVLTRRPGVVFSREKLLDLIRGDGSVVAERIIDTYIRRLRRKFEAVDPSFAAIETVIGAGYTWKPRGRS